MSAHVPAAPEAPLDSDAEEAVRTAFALARDETVGALHLLRALTDRNTPFAAVLEDLGLHFDLSGLRAAEGDVSIYPIVRSAGRMASAMGASSAGRHHLFVAAVDAAAGSLREHLRNQDVTPGRARALLNEASERLPGRERPFAVSAVAGLLVLQSVGCGCVGSLLIGGTGFSQPFSGGDLAGSTLLWIAWTGTASFGLGAGLLARQRWAWAGGVGFLVLQVIGTLHFFVQTRGLPPGLIAAIVYGVLAASLYLRGEWFSVPRHWKARTLWRSGWWAIVPTLALQLARLLREFHALR